MACTSSDGQVEATGVVDSGSMVDDGDSPSDTAVEVCGEGALVVEDFPLQGSLTETHNELSSPSCASEVAPGAVRAFDFVACETGEVTFNTGGSAFDTVLFAVDDSGNELGCSDDAAGLSRIVQSKLTVPLVEGQAIQIAVGGYVDSAFGDFQVNVGDTNGQSFCEGEACNQTCADRQTSIGEYPIVVDTRLSSSDFELSECDGGGPDEAWLFTAAEAGSYRFEVDSSFDAAFYAMHGSCHESFGACDFDDWQLQVELDLAAGETATLVLDGYAPGYFGVAEVHSWHIPADGIVDDSTATARSLVWGQTTATIQPLRDEDFFTFTAEAGRRYVFETVGPCGVEDRVDPRLVLYDSDGATILRDVSDLIGTRCSRIEWTADGDGTRYLRVTGTNANSGFRYGTGHYGLDASRSLGR
ncbi:MAG: PPC domain-containing protein [Proteobacteria bacterium]|nr:PPC domain-containing protein [Pseudomonadota bacterium]